MKKRLLVSIVILLFSASAVFAEVDKQDAPPLSGECEGKGPKIRLSWTPPTTNADLTPLTDQSHFKIYWGFEDDCSPYCNEPHNFDIELKSAGWVSAYTVDMSCHRLDRNYYYTVTAFDTSGNESKGSNKIVKFIATPIPTVPDPDTTPPAPPAALLGELVAMLNEINDTLAVNERELRDQWEAVRVKIKALEDDEANVNFKSELTTLRFQASAIKSTVANIVSYRNVLTRLIEQMTT